MHGWQRTVAKEVRLQPAGVLKKSLKYALGLFAFPCISRETAMGAAVVAVRSDEKTCGAPAHHYGKSGSTTAAALGCAGYAYVRVGIPWFHLPTFRITILSERNMVSRNVVRSRSKLLVILSWLALIDRIAPRRGGLMTLAMGHGVFISAVEQSQIRDDDFRAVFFVAALLVLPARGLQPAFDV